MTEKEILNIFQKTDAILKGHFKLSSGLHSAEYLQCAQVLSHPEHAERLCKALVAKFTSSPAHQLTSSPNIVIAPALGGILVSYEVARALGAQSLFTERVDPPTPRLPPSLRLRGTSRRASGKMTLRRGFELNKDDKVLVVEDVVTTGLSTKEVIEVVKSFGATLVGVCSIVDRSKEKIDFGVPFENLVKINIPTFEPQMCPLCKDKIPLTKPGSRR